MFAIILIYVMLFSFVIIIVSSLCYLIYIDWTTKRFDKRVNKIHDDFSKQVISDLEDIENKNAVNEEHIHFVTKKLKRRAYEKVFQNTIVAFANTHPRHVVPEYATLYEHYLLKKVKQVKPNGSVKHVQNIFMLGEYRVNHSSIIRYLIKGVQSQSIMTRFSSMSAISKIGNAEALVEALMIASNQRRYMNMKVLTDIIDNFEGDKELLNTKLVNVFMQFSKEVRILIITHFYNEHSTVPLIAFDGYLENVTDKEELISLLKYFGVIQHPEALPKITKTFSNESWEIRAIAAKTLMNYSEYMVVKDIIAYLSDENWYVRTNLASSILKHIFDVHDCTSKDIDDLIEYLDDKYAKGAIEYARHLLEPDND